MQISNTNSKEGVAEYLAAIEAEYGIRFPSEYRNFMIKYNGGEAPETRIKMKKEKGIGYIKRDILFRELKELFMYLLKNGADYESKDNFNNSCLDYANQFIWRNDFIDIVEEYKGSKLECIWRAYSIKIGEKEIRQREFINGFEKREEIKKYVKNIKKNCQQS